MHKASLIQPIFPLSCQNLIVCLWDWCSLNWNRHAGGAHSILSIVGCLPLSPHHSGELTQVVQFRQHCKKTKLTQHWFSELCQHLIVWSVPFAGAKLLCFEKHYCYDIDYHCSPLLNAVDVLCNQHIIIIIFTIINVVNWNLARDEASKSNGVVGNPIKQCTMG